MTRHTAHRLPVATELLRNVALPGAAPRRAELVGGVATVAETTVGTARASKTTSLTALVGRADNPVDLGVVTDGGGGGINEDALEVLVGGVGANPVAVEDTHATAVLANTALGHGLEVALVLDLADTSGSGLTVGDTVVELTLAATTANTDTPDGISELRLVSETVSLIRTGGLLKPDVPEVVAPLPGANTAQITSSVALLVLPQLLQIGIKPHQ